MVFMAVLLFFIEDFVKQQHLSLGQWHFINHMFVDWKEKMFIFKIQIILHPCVYSSRSCGSVEGHLHSVYEWKVWCSVQRADGQVWPDLWILPVRKDWTSAPPLIYLGKDDLLPNPILLGDQSVSGLFVHRQWNFSRRLFFECNPSQIIKSSSCLPMWTDQKWIQCMCSLLIFFNVGYI